MDKIALTKSMIQKMTVPTFPVVVEGVVLHFPIHHRHAPVGTVHTWGDGHKYRKTSAGWELVHEPGSAEAPGEPEKVTPPAPKAEPVPVASAAEPGKSRVEFRNGLHMIIDPSGREVTGFTTAKAAHDWLTKPLPDWKPSDMDKAKRHPAAHVPLPPDQALTAGTAAAEKKPVEKPREMFDMIAHTKWEDSVKPGDEVELRWTNSHNYYRARARVIANNDASISASLLHGIPSPYNGQQDTYGVGQKIVVPKSFNLKAFRARSLGSNKWSQSNGAFPVSDRTKPADTAKLDAHADVVKKNGTAKDYARGERILVHYPAKGDGKAYEYGPFGTIEYEVEKALYKNNMLALRPVNKDVGAYSSSIRLDGFPHRIEKKLDPKPEVAPLPHPGAGEKMTAAKASDSIDRRLMVVPRTASTSDRMTHAVMDSETNASMAYHPSREEAQMAADQLRRYHGREFHVADIEPAKRGAHEPDSAHTTSTDSFGGWPVKHYDTKTVKRSLSALAHHTHAVVDSDTGEVISTHGEGSAGVEAASGGGARRHMTDQSKMGHQPNGKRAHVDTLEPYTDEHRKAHQDVLDAAKKKGDEERAARANHPDNTWIRGPEQLAPVIPERPKHVSPELHDAITKFAHTVSAEKAKYAVQGGFQHKIHVDNFTPKVHYKRTYAYVDVGSSGKYMIPLVKPNGRMDHAEVGDVHGIESAYGVPHPHRRYGNVLKGTAKAGAY